MKDKSRLRLTRKRQSSQQADEDSPETSESKQRRLMNDESVVPDREKTECQDIQVFTVNTTNLMPVML